MNINKKKVVIIGAGPAGLTAAFELLTQSDKYEVTVLEATDRIGGISCTINHNGNRIDIGGHRFFSKSDTVMDWWQARMPIQNKPAYDDKILNKSKDFSYGSVDPEVTDNVLLIRERLSRIFYARKFFDYPISLKVSTILNLGIIKTFIAGLSYLKSQCVKKLNETNLENFLINRFGKKLYKMFFESYTEKVWGAHPRDISSDWGAQRIKGLSLSKAILDPIKKAFRANNSDIRQKNTETSLIEKFLYPKLGPGQLWENVASEIEQLGGVIKMTHKVESIDFSNSMVNSISANVNNSLALFECDYCISTMPIKDLVNADSTDHFEKSIKDISSNLPYRNFVTVGLLVDKMSIENDTKIKTLNNVVPDTWIYIQESEVKLCRLQIFNNWSPYMVEDKSKVWLGLEYMCSDEDDIWTMDDKDCIDFAINELVLIGMIKSDSVLDSCRINIDKAYPAYFGSYDEFPKVKQKLDEIHNLYCIGRNGQHRYNNQDHSMLSAMEAVKNIVNDVVDNENIWNVNVEKDYHEEK